MIYNDVIFGTVPTESVNIDLVELSTRLGRQVDISAPWIQECIKKCKKSIVYRYAYVSVPIDLDASKCDFGFSSVESTALSKVLNSYNNAFIMAVTIGINVDRLISRLAIQSPSEAFIIDAIASSAVESFADYINGQLANSHSVGKRFSPGYSDFPLRFQSQLLERLNAQKTLGIQLSSDLLMTPMKSITAVIGY